MKAKALVQYFIGNNGYFGCSFCEQQGEHTNKHYYPFENKQVKRTKASVKQICQHIRDNNKTDVSITTRLLNVLA